jgi:hypothetical protein
MTRCHRTKSQRRLNPIITVPAAIFPRPVVEKRVTIARTNCHAILQQACRKPPRRRKSVVFLAACVRTGFDVELMNKRERNDRSHQCRGPLCRREIIARQRSTRESREPGELTRTAAE